MSSLRNVVLVFCAALLTGCFGQTDSTGSGATGSRATGVQGDASSRGASGPAPAGASAPMSYDFSSVDALLEDAAPGLGGCALLIVKDGAVVYRRAFGGYDPGRVIPIASATKWLSGALLMSLVDEGRLALDDPVSKYVPGFTGPKAAITVRQLFAHTSGLPAEARCRNDKATTLERCADEIARLRLASPPGSEFRYGGASMQVGGRVAEVAGGKPWSDLFRERIAAPLGMKRTDYFAYGETANPRIAGDGRSTLDDYGRFLAMILAKGTLDGKRVLSEEAVAEMQRDQTRGAPIAYTIYQKFGRLEPSLLEARYGVGVWREVVDARTGRVREISSQGALGFSPWIDLERNLAGVLAVRSSQTKVMPVYVRLKRELRRVVGPEAGSAGP